MNVNMMTLCLVISSVAILFTSATLVISILAYATVVGLKKSTHTMIRDTSSWQPPPFDDSKQPEYGEEIQDAPQKSKPLTLKEQMSEHMYPDISEEQV